MFRDRWFGNKVSYMCYRFMRMFYVSVFYYFIPFISIVMSTLIPVLYRRKYRNGIVTADYIK